MKLIGIDLDGTLLNSRQTISLKNVNALKNLSKNTLPFICSGRDINDIRNILRDNGLDILIVGLNGALGYNQNQKLFDYPFDLKNIKTLYNLISEYPTKIYTNQGNYEPENYIKHLKNTFNTIGQEFPITELNYELEYEEMITSIPFQQIDDVISLPNIKIYKFFVFIPNREIKRLIAKKLNKLSFISIDESSETNFEIIPLQASKGLSFQHIEDIYKLENVTRFAIGDSLNDLSLLKHADYSFAMENGHPKIKEIANEITASNDNDGVAKALAKIENFKY